jgi:hypothetical protein
VNSSQDFRESNETNDNQNCGQKEYILPNVLNEDLENPKTKYVFQIIGFVNHF